MIWHMPVSLFLAITKTRRSWSLQIRVNVIF